MAVTQNTYTGDGATVLFSFTFPYLETSDIKVSVNGTITTEYSLANATTIEFDDAPADDADIRIFRETDDATLAATFYPGSAIRSQDLNENFTQNLYVTQESNRNAFQAIDTADGATATANTALTNSETAIDTADSAVVTADNAVDTADSAVVTANSAVATSNIAASDAAAAVVTANAAASDAADAVSTADGAVSTANSATSTANTALSNSETAIDTADSAVVIANSAVDTADAAVVTADAAVVTADQAAIDAQTAIDTADAAVVTAGLAVDTADAAVVTANAADGKADQAIAAVANALLFDIVANVAAIPASPDDQDAVEVTDGTGIENFTPLSGVPSGFVGDSGLSVRLIYDDTNSTWLWLQYFPNDPENRYGDAIVTLQGDVSTAQGDISALQGDVSTAQGDISTLQGDVSTLQGDLSTAQGDITTLQTDVLGLDSAKLDVTTAASTYAPIDDASLTGLTLAESIGVETSVGFSDADQSHAVFLQAPSVVPANITFSLPSADGTSGQYLTTDGSGQLSFNTLPTTLVPDDIGVTVQGYDATTLKSADIGVTVQGYDADLAAVAALTTTGLVNRTGSGTAATLTVPSGDLVGTSATQTLTNKTLTSPELTGAPYVNGSYRGNLVAVASLDINCSLGNYFTKTISANSTFTFSSVPAATSYAFVLEITHSSGTITWPSSVKWPSDGAPTLTTGKTHLFVFVTDDGGSRFRGASLIDYVN